MLSTRPFEEISLWKRDRERFLHLLFQRIVDSGRSAAIVTRTHGSMYDAIHVIQHNDAHLYHLQSTESVFVAVQLIVNTKPWHRGAFSIIVCETMLIDCLKKNPHLITAPVPTVERFVQDTIRGYTFPLDDALAFYGDDDIQKMTTAIMLEFRSA